MLEQVELAEAGGEVDADRIAIAQVQGVDEGDVAGGAEVEGQEPGAVRRGDRVPGQPGHRLVDVPLVDQLTLLQRVEDQVVEADHVVIGLGGRTVLDQEEGVASGRQHFDLEVAVKDEAVRPGIALEVDDEDLGLPGPGLGPGRLLLVGGHAGQRGVAPGRRDAAERPGAVVEPAEEQLTAPGVVDVEPGVARSRASEPRRGSGCRRPRSARPAE